MAEMTPEKRALRALTLFNPSRALTFAVETAIKQAVQAEREACAMLHEQVNPASDEERFNDVPGAGAMGAVIEYRDLIRARGESTRDIKEEMMDCYQFGNTDKDPA